MMNSGNGNKKRDAGNELRTFCFADQAGMTVSAVVKRSEGLSLIACMREQGFWFTHVLVGK